LIERIKEDNVKIETLRKKVDENLQSYIKFNNDLIHQLQVFLTKA